MKQSNINQICFEAAFWPAVILIILSILLSGVLFSRQMHDLYQQELMRHELIFQLISKAIITDIIIKNEQAIYISLKDFKEKYNLTNIKVEDNVFNPQTFKAYKPLSNTFVKSTWELPGIKPNKYVVLQSSLGYKSVILPLTISIGIIVLFIIASIVMYKRIKAQLNKKIISPLKHTLQSDNRKSEFDFNQAAVEISNLYLKTQNHIKTLHNQRDIIEKQKIKSAQYEMALQVAHDIRSPALALEAIGETSDLKNEDKKLINKVIRRILEIADNILITHKQSMPSKENQNLENLIEHLVNEKKSICKKSSVKIYFKPDKNFNNIKTTLSADQFNRVLSNLIDNSLEAIKQSGQIFIYGKVSDRIVQIIVKDTGIGIPEKQVKLVFDKNYTVNKKNGNGLGLSYIKKIIEEHNGSIKIKSAAGKGTCVDLCLPVFSIT